MAVIKLGDLTTFEGDASGSWLVMNDPTNTATYKVQREQLMSGSTALSASYALTASYLDNYTPPFPYTGSAEITGSLTVTGSTNLQSVTASSLLTTGTITAQTLVVQTITSSVDFVTGSTRFGSLLTDTHQFTGSVSVTGSLLATASWALNVPASGVVGLNLNSISSGSVTASVNVNSASFQLVSASSTLLFVSSSGNVGVGTSTPAYTLDVNGAIRTTGLSLSTGYSFAVQRLQFNAGIAGGNIGYVIGTSNGVIRLMNAAENDFTRLQFGGTTNLSPALQKVSSSLAVVDAAGTTASNLLVGSTTDTGYKLLVSGSGTSGSLNVNNTLYVSGSRVGVLIASPAYELDIAGDVRANRVYTDLIRDYTDGNNWIRFSRLNASNNWIEIGTSGTTNSQSLFVKTTGNVQVPNGNFLVGSTVDTGYKLLVSGSGVSGSMNVNNTLYVSGSRVGIGTGTPAQSLDVSGSARITANLTASRAFLSSSNGTASGSTLIVFGSGSTQPVFTVQGSQGELFSVTDSLSGSLFSVNDVSGLPVIEAFSDNTVLIGSYQAPMLMTTVRTTLAVGNNVIYRNIPTASYDAVFFEYSLRSGSNARAGSIMGIWSGSDANYNEVVTADYGDTTGVKFMVMVTGSNVALTGSAATANWTMKTIVRGI